MNSQPAVLVLGAYGLAGRAIVARLLQTTALKVIAAGRNPDKLHSALAAYGDERVRACVFDAMDADALRSACADAAVVINAAGPFAKDGAEIARRIIAAQRPYVDCANEQLHYRRLKALDNTARNAGLPMVTGAGAIPGFSTLLAAHMLEACPNADALNLAWVQLRHAHADTGLASIMGGVLDALDAPLSLTGGALVPLQLGAQVCSIDFPPPFGKTHMLEAPTLDTLLLGGRGELKELHTWFHLTDIPPGLMKVVRLLQPQRRPWAYKLIAFVAGRLNNADTAKALANDLSPAGLLQVTVSSGAESQTRWMLFRDGGCATACLPVRFAEDIVRGKITSPGLLTPLDCYAASDLAQLAGEHPQALDQ